MKKTKIIATIGPSSNNKQTLIEMVKNGLNVVRINLSHSTQAEHQKVVDIVKEIRKELNVSLPIMVDTRGPEVRVGKFKNQSEVLEKNQTFTFDSNPEDGDNTRATINHPQILKQAEVGSVITANNGLIRFKVVENNGDNIVTKVLTGGKISNHKSMSLPDVALDIPYLNELDKADMIWAIKNDVELIALSFVSDPKEVLETLKFIKANKGDMRIISKIESKRGVNNLDKIIDKSYGVMVARGDLGVEMALDQIPPIQKMMITKANDKAKVVVTATEMLESMIENVRPTRAEASDVANAVYDRTTAIMLSGESAVGINPPNVIKTMATIAKSAENAIDYQSIFNNINYNSNRIDDVISYATVSASFSIKTKAIVVFSEDGTSARNMSHFNPNCPIIALTSNIQSFHRMNILYGVIPVLVKKHKQDISSMIQVANQVCLDNDLAKKGDLILVSSASRTTQMHTDYIKFHYVG